MQKTFLYAWRSLVLLYKANGYPVVFDLIGRLYDGTIYQLIQVFLLARILDLFASGKDLELYNFYWIAAAYAISSLVKIAFQSYHGGRDVLFQSKLEGYIDVMIAKKLTELDPATFEDPKFQNVLAQVDGVVGSMIMQTERFITFLAEIFKFLTAALVLLFIFPIFIPIIVVAIIPSFLVGNSSRSALWPFFNEKRSPIKRLTKYINDLLSSDSTSKEAAIYRTGNLLIAKIKKVQKTYYTAFEQVLNNFVGYMTLTGVFEIIAFIFTQYMNLMRTIAKTSSVGQFTLVFQQTLTLSQSTQLILNQYSSMGVRNKYIDIFYEFIDTAPKVTSPSNPIAFPNTPSPAVIEFKNVTFRYPNTERDILHGFNLKMNSGEKVALVGENGAGKTTIIKLLLRFYDVTEGELLINGVNVKELSLEDWHKQVGALFQDFIKYQFTFKENVYFGNLDEKNNEELLIRAIKESGANSYIDHLPEKYDQVVGKMFDGGIDLSGGQWQKLALARAFFRNAPFLILDEPTSAIDAKAEYEIFQHVQQLQEDKTVIIISHRFSTVRNADRILVLEEGKIVEEGNHEKLMKAKGLYAELFELQAQGYK